jgi:hypothetical protein
MNSNHQNSHTNCTLDRLAFGRAISSLFLKTLTALGESGTATAKHLLSIWIPLLAIIIFIGATAGNASAQAGRISGYAYFETDGNRGLNPGVDVPLSGVAINICPGTDPRCVFNPIRRVTTNSEGFYEFTNLAAANYVILLNATETRLYRLSISGEKDPGPGYAQFAVQADSDLKHDFVADLGIPSDSLLGDGTFYGVRNAYYGGRIWNDANGNGLYEASEAKLSGANLSLYYDYNSDGIPDLPYPAATYASNAGGQYVLKASGHTAAPGTYPVLVCLNPENFSPGGALAGYQPGSFSINDPNNQIDNDNNVASSNQFGFCTRTLNPLRGKLMATTETDRMTVAAGAPADAGDGLFDETIDLGLTLKPAGSAPVSSENKSFTSPAAESDSHSSVYGPISEVGELPADTSPAADSSFFINRASHERSFGFYNRERVPGGPLANPGLAKMQSVVCSGGRALRVETSGSGLVRLAAETIAATGFNLNNPLRLFADGREEPISVEPDGSVIFLARGLDTQHTNARVYFLSDALPAGGINSSPLRILLAGAFKSRKRTRFFAPEPGRAVQTNQVLTGTLQRQKSVYETNDLNLTAALNGPNVDNFYSLLIGAQPAAFSMSAPGIQPSPGDGSRIYLTLDILALTQTFPPAYELQIRFNDQLLPTLAGSSFQQKITVEIPGELARTENTLVLRRPDGRATILKRAVLEYSRPYAAADAAQQVFEIRKNNFVAVTGYAAGEAIRVFDISKFGATSELKVSLQTDAATGGAFFNVPVDPAADRKIVVVRSGGFFAPKQVVLRANSRLLEGAANLAADYLIIGPEEFAEPMERLRHYRASQGVSGKVVFVRDIYDEYAFGRAEPQAITEFLRDTSARWSVKPKNVLLAGNATFDPKNYLGSGMPNRVPTMMTRTSEGEYAGDDLLFNITGDVVGDFYWGRFPARSSQMLDDYVTKIIGYEQNPVAANRPAVLFDDDNIGYNFDQTIARFQAALPAGTSNTAFLKTGRTAADVKADVVNFINANHPKIINYAGHGATGQLSGSNVFDNTTVNSLTNQNELAFGIILACLAFGTESPYALSVGESLIKGPAGMIAGIGSTGLTGLPGQESLVLAFYSQLRTNPGIAVGEALQKAKVESHAQTNDNAVIFTWVLLGDPLIRIR